jgi:predicted transcriptional regulator YdeE
MSETTNAAIVTFQMHHEEFLFLGKEYPLVNPDFVKIWDDFLGAGSYEIIEKYQKNPYADMNICHNSNPEHETFFIGRIVEGIIEAPEGFTLMKVPACEYFVVTHEWIPGHVKYDYYGENGGGLGQSFKYLETAQMPDGYVRCGGEGHKIKHIEVDNHSNNNPNGGRIEIWVPIKKLSFQETKILKLK